MEALHLNSFSYVGRHPTICRKKTFSSTKGRWRILAVIRTTRPDNELSAQDLLELFLRERQVTGDVITKTSDIFWKKEVLEVDERRTAEVKEKFQQPQKIAEDERGGGYLKLSCTKEWVSGNDEAPVNENASRIEWKTDRGTRRKMGLLEYEALKRELLLITVGVGAACSGYCFFVISPQVALSYAAGAVTSFFYLKLLYHHADNISKENMAEVFTRKRAKKIGIRSDDLRDSFEKIAGGSAIALSSPRLVIPAAIFGFWALSKHLFADSFDFQVVFAWKTMSVIFGIFILKNTYAKTHRTVFSYKYGVSLRFHIINEKPYQIIGNLGDMQLGIYTYFVSTSTHI